MLKSIGITLLQFGLDPPRALRALRGIPAFVRDFAQFIRKGGKVRSLMPILGERYESSGQLPTHYFHQDLWAARKIHAANPGRHVDIGSAIASFVAHLLVFRKVEVVDIRPLSEAVDGLSFTVADATTLDRFPDNSLESISSLNAAEHFGLGRYGDPVDPEAHLTFMGSLQRVLAPGGRLYFSVPCGVEQVCFNSHRVLSPQTVLSTFSNLELVSFSCIKDDRNLYLDCDPTEVANQTYGCGLFELTKPQYPAGG